MADQVPIRAGLSGASLTGLAIFASGETIGVAHGGTGVVTIGSNQLVTGNGTSAMTSESNLTFDGTILKATGDLCATVKVVAPALCIGSEYVLPTADGSAGQIMCTDGSGALAFATASAGVTLAGSTNNTIATVTGANALAGEAELTFDGTDLAIGNAAPSSYMDSVHGLIIGDTGDVTSEIVLATSTSGVGALNFTDTVNTTNQAYLRWHHTGDYPTNHMELGVHGGTHTYFMPGPYAVMGGTTQTNANMGIGWTINQTTYDNEILSFKSSDVAHGMTTVTETDTYGMFKKPSPDNGGLGIYGLAESAYNAVIVYGFTTGQEDTHSANGGAAIVMRAGKKDGTDAGTIAGGGNLFGIYNHGQGQVFLVDGDGDTYYAGGTNANHWDDEDDIGLLSTFRNLTTGKKAQHVFGEFIQDNAQALHDSGVITLNDDGNHFVSTKGLNALIIDTIRQEGKKWREVIGDYKDKIAQLESRLMRLEA